MKSVVLATFAKETNVMTTKRKPSTCRPRRQTPSCRIIKHVTLVERISAIVIFPVGAVEGLIRLTHSTRNSRVNPTDPCSRDPQISPDEAREGDFDGHIRRRGIFEVNVQFAEDDKEIANTRKLLEWLL